MPPPPPQVLSDDHDALPAGARLGEFEILRVLGVGGFGIVYLALDHALDRQVAIKEYMPATLAARGDGSHVSLRSSSHAETFAVGLKSFVNEAKLLARFDHPSLVKVYRFWEQHGTAYMVMPFYPGRTLKEERRAMGHAPAADWVLHQLIEPLLGALELLHREGVYHRDIAPDNILVQPGSPPVLLDFGAARRVIGDRTQTLTAILKPNFAPIEQYADVSHLRQGPWTDLYALGAVLHFIVTGKPPMPAAARAVHDELQPLGAAGGPHAGSFPPALLKTIDWALAVRPNERPQSVAQLREALAGRLQPPERPVVDIGMSPTMPADQVANAWARTAPVGDAAVPPAPSDAGHEATVRDVPRAVPAPPSPTPAPRGPTAAVPATAAVQRGAPATAPAEAAARAAARRKRRRIGWATTALAMVGVAAVSWFLGERYGSNDDDNGPPMAAASSPATTLPITAAGAASAMPATAAPVVTLPSSAAAVTAVQAVASQAVVPPARKPPVVARAPQSRPVAPPASPPRPAPAEPVPAAASPAPAPATPVDTGPKSPREACGSRVFIAMMRCMERECETTRFYEHPQCRKLRRQEDIRNSR
jgi:hypothetical protein